MFTFSIPLSDALLIINRGSLVLTPTPAGYTLQTRPANKFGVTFTLTNAIPTDIPIVQLKPNYVKQLDVHVIKYNQAVRRLLKLCQSKGIPIRFYDNASDWVRRNGTKAISVNDVKRLTTPHTDHWWHEQYDRLLLDWAELLYHHTFDQLSRSATNTLKKLDKMGQNEDVVVVFDMVSNDQPPSIEDYRLTLLISRQLSVHSIETYDQMVKFLRHKWHFS